MVNFIVLVLKTKHFKGRFSKIAAGNRENFIFQSRIFNSSIQFLSLNLVFKTQRCDTP